MPRPAPAPGFSASAPAGIHSPLPRADGRRYTPRRAGDDGALGEADTVQGGSETGETIIHQLLSARAVMALATSVAGTSVPSVARAKSERIDFSRYSGYMSF